MDRFKVTRPKPSGGFGDSEQKEFCVIERAEPPAEMYGRIVEKVAKSTPLSDWADVPAEPAQGGE